MTPPRTSPVPCILLGLLAGLMVRLLWMPTWSRLSFDGHERLYLAAYQGQPPDPSAQAWPMLCWIYQGLGMLSDDPILLTIFSAIAGASAVAGAALWAHRELGPREGLWVAAFLVVLPEHVAWSTSPYHVILPHALLVWGFVLPRWWAALCIALACSMRPELCLVAPFAGKPGLAGLVGIGWWAGLGASLPAGDPLLALRANLPMLGYLGPAILALSLAGFKDRRCWGLIGLAAVVHITGSVFADYGARHALLGGVALCVVCAAVVARWTPVLGLIVLILLGRDTQELSNVWLARTALPDAALDLPMLASTAEAEAPAQPVLPEGCVEISEEPPIEGQPVPSHFLFLSGEIDSPCVLWGAEFWHHQWSSRGLRDRARRMASLYSLKPVAQWQTGQRPKRIYYQVTR